ncbi:MAG: hypothetical protein RL268_2407 [Pseudomonadota bacterium]|jgi:hypothetical protein
MNLGTFPLRSIETAPRDGTWILLVGGEQDHSSEYEAERAPMPPMVVARWEGDDYSEGWRFALYDGGYYGIWNDPTGWLPLPDVETKA